MIDLTQETKIWLTAATLVLVASVLGFCIVPSHGHDIYEQLTKGTGCSCGSTIATRLCEPVEAIAMSALTAKHRHLKYRIPGWGKLAEPDEDGYYLPSSGEFIPASWAFASPDERFHRCTFPRNMMWQPNRDATSPTTGKWIEVPNPSTLDGKPMTQCLFHPVVGF